MTQDLRFAVALLCLVATGCAPESSPPAETATATASEPPAPTVDAPSEAESYASACDARAVEARRMLAALEKQDGPTTVETVLVPYNELLVVIFDGEQDASLINNVHPDASVRDAAGRCEQTLAGVDAERLLSRPLFERAVWWSCSRWPWPSARSPLSST